MQHSLLFILITHLLSLNINAQDYLKIEVETNVVSNLNADQAWNIVQDWEHLNERVPGVVESTVVNGKGMDSSWQINLKNGSQIFEKMHYYNSNERTMSYIMTKTPMPIKDYMAIIKVETYGVKKSLISFYTQCNSLEENLDNITATFKTFQETYLSNIKNLDYE